MRNTPPRFGVWADAGPGWSRSAELPAAPATRAAPPSLSRSRRLTTVGWSCMPVPPFGRGRRHGHEGTDTRATPETGAPTLLPHRARCQTVLASSCRTGYAWRKAWRRAWCWHRMNSANAQRAAMKTTPTTKILAIGTINPGFEQSQGKPGVAFIINVTDPAV